MAGYLELPVPIEKGDVVITSLSETKMEDVLPKFVSTPDPAVENDMELLDTFPSRFEYDQKMLYSHFAHYDYATIRNAEGNHQTAMLRQLADLFDKTGKILFYYYAVPTIVQADLPTDCWRDSHGVKRRRRGVCWSGRKRRSGGVLVLG